MGSIRNIDNGIYKGLITIKLFKYIYFTMVHVKLLHSLIIFNWVIMCNWVILAPIYNEKPAISTVQLFVTAHMYGSMKGRARHNLTHFLTINPKFVPGSPLHVLHIQLIFSAKGHYP